MEYCGEGGSESKSTHQTAIPSCPELPLKDHRGLWIFGESDSKRRVVFIERKNGSYGFTLQSYGVRYKHGNRETDFITYVNAVEKNGAAHHAGLREGDVILSINGQNMARVEHKSLVGFIRQCPTNLKMVVVSDERARKVELHMRYVHLKKKLQDKVRELEDLDSKERSILNGTFVKSACSGIAHLEAAASSVCCFCPPHHHRKKTDACTSSKNPPLIFTESEHEKLKHVIQQRSKSVKLPSEKEKTDFEPPTKNPNQRKCVSSRELNSTNNNNQTNIGHSNANGKSGNSCKPKSWDNLVTKSFGGYGYGFGYGYFPTAKDAAHVGGCYSITHPHHHNHHSHCSHHSTAHGSNYYKNSMPNNSKSSEASKVKVVYHYVPPPAYHALLPSSSRPPHKCMAKGYSLNLGDEVVGENTGRSKTLPSKRGVKEGEKYTGAYSGGKLEKTFSDSSLSDHYKELTQTMSYFKRAGDNVRFSSEEEIEIYGNRGRKSGRGGAKVKERIIV